MNFLRQCFGKLSSDRHTYIHTDRQRDKQTDRQNRPKLYSKMARVW